MDRDRRPLAGLVLRALGKDDSIEELTELLHRAYAPLAAMGFAFVATHQNAAATRKRTEKGECFVGLLDERLVATVTFMPPGRSKGTPWYERPDVAKFQQLAVDPSLARRGIGSALMDLVENRARALGAAEIALDTAEGAAHLIAVYRARGYRFVGHADWRPETNYRSVIMSLALKPKAGRPDDNL